MLTQKKIYSLIDTINAIASKYNLPVIISTHPRTKKDKTNKKFKNT